jgi:hypothetical protein
MSLVLGKHLMDVSELEICVPKGADIKILLEVLKRRLNDNRPEILKRTIDWDKVEIEPIDNSYSNTVSANNHDWSTIGKRK